MTIDKNIIAFKKQAEKTAADRGWKINFMVVYWTHTKSYNKGDFVCEFDTAAGYELVTIGNIYD